MSKETAHVEQSHKLCSSTRHPANLATHSVTEGVAVVPYQAHVQHLQSQPLRLSAVASTSGL